MKHLASCLYYVFKQLFIQKFKFYLQAKFSIFKCRLNVRFQFKPTCSKISNTNYFAIWKFFDQWPGFCKRQKIIAIVTHFVKHFVFYVIDLFVNKIVNILF